MFLAGNTVTRVTELVQPKVEALGLTLWDVRFVKEGASWYLRIFIDKPGGITIDDCTENREIREEYIPARFKAKKDWKELNQKLDLYEYVFFFFLPTLLVFQLLFFRAQIFLEIH